MEIYHHTKFENLEKIVTMDGLSFRGSYYEEFSDLDYKWTKRIVSRIIECICKQRKVEYDKTSGFKPIIISFGMEMGSDYMWTKYAQQYSGIQLALNYDVLAKVAYNNLDYFSKCVYMRKRGRMKRFIERKTHKVESINDIQCNLESVSALIKPVRFRQENEVRYIREYSKLVEVNYENYLKVGDKAFIDCIPSEYDKERFVIFPKEALVGISIGNKSIDKLEVVRELLKERGYELSKIPIRIYPQNL